MTASPILPGRATPTPDWFAWLALFFALWLLAGLSIALNALNDGLTNDVGFSIYHLPFYLCLGALAATSLVLVVRAARAGRRWTEAFPPGYGSLGAGLLVLVAWPFVDVGWREGVGIASSGIETGLAPSRIILGVGVLLVLVTPLRAALRAGGGVNPWPAVVSTALVIGLVQPAGFHPAENPWLEHVRLDPNSEVWAMDADGTHQTRLISAGDGYEAWSASWSPDGREIAFSRVHRGPEFPDDTTADIWIAQADGTGSRPLVQRGSYKWLPHWSPDGVWIVYTDEPVGGPWGTTVPRSEGPGGFLGPGFNPGGPTAAREPAHIWRVRADGTSAPEQITNVDANDRAATYSPDGSRLAFDSTRDKQTRIWVMNADGSDPRRLTDGGNDWGATWSPDGRWIAYKSLLGPWMAYPEVFVMAPDGSGRRQVTSGLGDIGTLTWSPDSTRIAFELAKDGRGAIWSIGLDGANPQNLSNDRRAAVGMISGGGAWRSDGRIVYTRGEDPPASADPLVREGLGTAAMLLVAILISLAAVVVRIGPPFGAFALILGISTALIAGMHDQWRFVPAAIVGGLIVDLLVRHAPPDRKAHVAGAGLPAAVVLGTGLTVVATTGLGWSPTLLLGVALAGTAIGWVLGGLVGRPRPDPTDGLPA
jgi:TolB protein